MLVSRESCIFERLAKNCSHAVLSSYGVRFLDLPLAWPSDTVLCLLQVQHCCNKHADHATVPVWTRRVYWYCIVPDHADVVRDALAKFGTSEAAEALSLAPMT
jgi:hypothetical protein